MACTPEAKTIKIEKEQEEEEKEQEEEEKEQEEKEKEKEEKEKEKNVKIIHTSPSLGWDSDEDGWETDEDYPDRYATDAELREYHIQVIESEGFDVEDFKGIILGGIGPCPIDEYNEQLLIELSNLALQTYNDQNGASFKFDNLIKATQQVVSGYMYYITFAAHSGDTSGTFRGKLWLKINKEKEVEFCKMI